MYSAAVAKHKTIANDYQKNMKQNTNVDQTGCNVCEHFETTNVLCVLLKLLKMKCNFLTKTDRKVYILFATEKSDNKNNHNSNNDKNDTHIIINNNNNFVLQL